MPLHRQNTKLLMEKLFNSQPYNTPESLVKELASHCAILTLDLEQARAEIATLKKENERLSRQLAAQRGVSKVLAFAR